VSDQKIYRVVPKVIDSTGTTKDNEKNRKKLEVTQKKTAELVIFLVHYKKICKKCKKILITYYNE
jgi:hypothetical protein